MNPIPQGLGLSPGSGTGCSEFSGVLAHLTSRGPSQVSSHIIPLPNSSHCVVLSVPRLPTDQGLVPTLAPHAHSVIEQIPRTRHHLPWFDLAWDFPVVKAWIQMQPKLLVSSRPGT